VTVSGGLVSVVVNFLDEAAFLEEAIASVLAQTYSSWELLLVDDGSTDGSSRIARRHAEADPARIRYLEHPGHENRGTSASRNLGIASARGEFVAFLDGDDVWLPRRLERSVALLREHPQAQMVYGATQYWHGWLGAAAPARDRVQGHWFRANRVLRPPDLLVRYLTLRAALPSPVSMTARRAALLEVGGFEESFRTLYDDQVFLVRFCLRHAVYVSNEWLDRYRQHADSTYAVGVASGEETVARRKYLAWVESYLEAQGFRDSEVWSALQFARARDERPATKWRSRLGRLVRRAADAVGTARFLRP
jgi:glycosyltransferase involved in cell wall biosynthesis